MRFKFRLKSQKSVCGYCAVIIERLVTNFYIPDPTHAMAAAVGTTTSVILVMVSSASA